MIIYEPDFKWRKRIDAAFTLISIVFEALEKASEDKTKIEDKATLVKNLFPKK